MFRISKYPYDWMITTIVALFPIEAYINKIQNYNYGLELPLVNAIIILICTHIICWPRERKDITGMRYPG